MGELFKNTLEAVRTGKTRENEQNTKLPTLERRLSIAQGCLKTPEDRWDYEEIKKDITSLEWAITDEKNEQKKRKNNQGNATVFSDDEIFNVLSEYSIESKEANVQYQQLWRQVETLTNDYSKAVAGILNEIRQIEQAAFAAQNISSSLPNYVAKQIQRLPIRYEENEYITTIAEKHLTLLNRLKRMGVTK